MLAHLIIGRVWHDRIFDWAKEEPRNWDKCVSGSRHQQLPPQEWYPLLLLRFRHQTQGERDHHHGEPQGKYLHYHSILMENLKVFFMSIIDAFIAIITTTTTTIVVIVILKSSPRSGVVHILRNHFWGSGETPPPLCNIVIIWAYPPLCNTVIISPYPQFQCFLFPRQGKRSSWID